MEGPGARGGQEEGKLGCLRVTLVERGHVLGVLSLVEGRLRSGADGGSSGAEVVVGGRRDGVAEEETESAEEQETGTGGDTDGDGERGGVALGRGNASDDDDGGASGGSEVGRGHVVARVAQIVDLELDVGAVARLDGEAQVAEPLGETNVLSDAIEADPGHGLGGRGSAGRGSGPGQVTLGAGENADSQLLDAVDGGINIGY